MSCLINNILLLSALHESLTSLVQFTLTLILMAHLIITRSASNRCCTPTSSVVSRSNSDLKSDSDNEADRNQVGFEPAPNYLLIARHAAWLMMKMATASYQQQTIE